VRVDNGAPWGPGGDLPPELALWLLGLGVEVHWNKPKQCTENGVVERSHGTLAGWAEPGTCRSADDLQTQLGHASRVQREVYPAVRGQTRTAAYPRLSDGGTAYDRAREGEQWDAQRVWRALARQVWTRRVDRVGRISVYNRPLGVGRAYAGQNVSLRFDAATQEWLIHDDAGGTLKRHPAPELSRERIVALAVSHRRPPRKRRPTAKARVLAPEGQPDAR